MLTVQILAKHDSLGDLKASLCPLNAEIQVIPRHPGEPADAARNAYVSKAKYDWILWLNPWEVLASGHETIRAIIKSKAAHRVQVLQQTTISKEVRLWNRSLDLKFTNPVYETLLTDAAFLPEVVVYSQRQRKDYATNLNMIETWKTSSPMAAEPYYYQACTLLSQQKYQDFLVLAEEFLFRRNHGVSAVMLKYYMAMTLLYVCDDRQSALKHIAECLTVHPLMAEFWCLLGDIFYKTGQYEKAKVFYENAILLGEKRLQSDEYPVEIPKYREYPEQMMRSCDDMIRDTVFFTESPVR